jgi:hypothetical protein
MRKRRCDWSERFVYLWRDLFQDQRRIVEHSQLEIAVRSKNMFLPIRFKRIRAY